LVTLFNGQEKDQFDSRFGGLSLSYRPSEKTKLKLLFSGFQTNEFETYDLEGEYGLYALESDLGKENFGQEIFSLGTGKIHDYARNYLEALVGTIAHKGSHDAGQHYFQWGIEGTVVKVADQLMEWQRRDSAGFSQPYHPQEVFMARSYKADNELTYTKAAAYIQDNILMGPNNNMTLNLGIRGTYTFLNEELLISPRIQYSLKPNWDHDIVFRLATGLYAQPAFYREMRSPEGILNTDLKA